MGMRAEFFNLKNPAGKAVALSLTVILAPVLLVPPILMFHSVGLAAPQQETHYRGEETVGTLSREAAEFAEALDALGKRVETPEFRVPGNAEANAASRLLYSLQSLPPVECYQLLKSFIFPTGNRKTIRNLMGLMNDVPPPAVFLPAPLPTPEEPLVCSLSLLVEAAREAHKLDELSKDLKPLLESNAEGASLLARMIEVVNTGDKTVRPRVSALLSERGLQQFLDSAQGTANFASVVWGYRERALATIAETEGASLKPTPDPGLKYWIPADLESAANLNQFKSTSWWVALDDRIGHVSSPWVDHLIFAYPLTGTFEISCEAFTGYWSESNVGYGGLIFEAFNLGSDTQVYPVNSHESLHSPDPVEHLDQFNPVTVRVWPKRLEVSANDELLFEHNNPSTTSPFFVLRTTWLSAFRRLRITGNPVIPREVSLIAGDRMDGWMTSFYNESQPPELTVGQSQPGNANVVARNDSPDAYDWSAKNGELYGRRFPELNSSDRQSGYQHGESWIYYHRPLRNAERISYEFFYKPGDEAVEVHRTIDRVAFLLRRPGVDLHWLTTNRSVDDPDGWIATSNVAVDPECRRGPSPLPLKFNDWNSCVVEIRDGTVNVMLNGQLVYERPMDVAAGARFGLYHDRTRTAARVRSVVLTGDWPEWSPELAAKLLERRNPLSPADVEAIENILTPRLTADKPEEM